MDDHTGTCITCFTCGETPCALIRDTSEIRYSFFKSDNYEGSNKEKRFQSYKRYENLYTIIP